MDALRDPFLPADSARSRWIVIFGVVLLLHAAILMWRIGWEPLSPAGPRKIELQTLAPEKLAAIKKQWSQTPKQLLLNKNPAAPDPTVAPPQRRTL